MKVIIGGFIFMVEVNNVAGVTKVADNIERVAALEFSFIDDLVALGISPVAIADDGNKENIIEPVRKHLDDYISVGDRENPDLDKLREAEPQLIIADSTRHKDIYDELNKITPTILLNSFGGDYKENLEAFKVVSQAVSKEDEGKARLEEHNKKVDEESKNISIDKKLSTLPVVPAKIGVAAHSDKSYVGQFLEILGFDIPLDQKDANKYKPYLDGPYLQMTPDQLAELDPERLIIMSDKEDENALDKLKNSDAYKKIKAVENDKVHQVGRLAWAKSRGLIASESIVKELSEFK
ncbi:iron citrate ABC transporter substrate-binding protein [Staphylococcus carnosus]|uniref:Similar to transport system binding proteins n=2 Tax=Staphylococcus carnosus TaxID=1281 RepID=B9DP83_STACT|nr:iron citrate ABC transporter substrate-binding protein [Staphylococcus carnosus]CAL27872.1 similar to transport system binding proteins [Staphylococcus carnosus subsp. carnosus TM300]UTB78425.1 iron citrate ABC transporter substrate-binding protein [Staphylococcus carnosus]UTB80808.1 iron citrate ABC transporter substrate-binding protein [Staphylococcus carnosus]UTB82729.1 iron citrate ABC transporter substrate-binding protein [Staphylococcus carnosus]